MPVKYVKYVLTESFYNAVPASGNRFMPSFAWLGLLVITEGAVNAVGDEVKLRLAHALCSRNQRLLAGLSMYFPCLAY